MKVVNEWEKKADEALNSLRGIKPASANPFLYTRIKARIEERQNKWVRVADFIGRPVVVISVAALFIGFNVWAIIEQPVRGGVSRHIQESEQSFDQDYATVNYSLGDLNK